MADQLVYEDKYFQIFSPEFPLNCRDDGGHLVLRKKEKVTDALKHRTGRRLQDY